MVSIKEIFIFILVVIYILYSSFIYDINKKGISPINIGQLGIGLVIIILTIYTIIKDLYSENKGLAFWLIFTIISLVTIVTLNMIKASKIEDDTEKNNYIANYKFKTLVGLIVFFCIGLLAYFLFNEEGECSSYPSLLCDGSYIMIFMLLSYTIYYCINYTRYFGKIGFLSEEKNKDSAKGLFSLFIIGLWQFYLYLVSDGFKYTAKDSSDYIKKQLGSGNEKMFKYIGISTLIYILYNFVSGIIKNNKCKDWGNNSDHETVNNIKEVQANIIVSTIVAFLMIYTISHTSKSD
jgi:hypothetical protein